MLKNSPFFLLSIFIHGVLIAVMLFSFSWEVEPQKPVNIIKAVVINDEQLQAEMEKIREKNRRKQAEEAQRQAELEQQALVAEEKRKVEEQRLIELEKERQVEEKRLIELEKKQQEELRRQAEEKIKQEAEAKRLAELKKKKEEERKKKEALKAKKAAENKKLAEEKKRKKAEKKRLAEKAQRKKEKEAKEAEAKRKAIAKAQTIRNKELKVLRSRYVDSIAQHVERYWRRPSSAKPGLSCTVKVKQIPGGEVIHARVGVCNGDQIVQRSIEHAVLRASPLPAPPDPELFDRNLVFVFKPTD